MTKIETVDDRIYRLIERLLSDPDIPLDRIPAIVELQNFPWDHISERLDSYARAYRPEEIEEVRNTDIQDYGK